MPEVLVATPLRKVTRPYAFADGISIRELSPISIAENSLSNEELEDLLETRFWLCASKDVQDVYGSVDDLYDKARYAMSALQIICPSGAKNVFLKFVHTDQGYDNIGDWRPRELCSTLIGRIASLEDRGLAQDFEAVYSLVKCGFTESRPRPEPNPPPRTRHADRQR